MEDNASMAQPTTPPPSISRGRRWFLLVLFCVAQFLEVFYTSAIFLAIPAVSAALHMTAQEGAWLIASYQLTFASFLLVSGRFSDVYNPKYVFVTGFLCFGLLSLGSGFCNQTIGLLVVRAFAGLTASTTIPSALHLIVNMFTSPGEQAQAVAVFGAMAAIGNVLGLILGAILIQFATWRWVFWIGAVVAIPVSLLSFFVIPNRVGKEHRDKPKNIDLVGFGLVTSALLLLIFSVTSGSSLGWGTPSFIAPFVISVLLNVVFLLWERTLPPERAALPPKLWRYPNLPVLAFVSLIPFFWYANIFYTLATTWQVEFHWSAINCAVHFLPVGILITVVIPFASRLPDYFSTKWITLTGDVLLIAGSVLLACSHTSRDYWRLDFPAFVIGTIGGTLVFSSTNITIFRISPPHMAGTVGAIYNAGLQLSTAVGIPIVTAIQVGVNGNRTDSFKGRSALFLFMLALVALQALIVLVFYKDRGKKEGREPEPGEEQEAQGQEKETETPKTDSSASNSSDKLPATANGDGTKAIV